MTLPVGQIKFSDVNTELGRALSASINLNDTQVRQLAGILSGTITMNNLRGKTWATSFSTSVAGGQINVRSIALSNGWNTYGPVTCTINSNSYSNSTGTPTILITGNFPTGLTLVINAGVYVVGKGGDAGAGGPSATAGSSGSAGGTAILVTGYSGGTLTFVNNGFIGGGGGGGGGGGSAYTNVKNGVNYYGGGGGGGGAGFGSGAAGGGANPSSGSAGGGGSINSPGGGGSPGSGSGVSGGSGGQGGSLGSSGASGAAGSGGSGGYAGGGGGAAGAATSGTIAAGVIWSVVGTRYGSIN